MDNLNASLTDKTGKEIVEALLGLGGGGSAQSSNGNIVMCGIATQYPDGEDPYANDRETVDELTWLDMTNQQIYDAVSNGKLVLTYLNVRVPNMENTWHTVLGYVSDIIYGSQITVELLITYENGDSSSAVVSERPTSIVLYCHSADDYPCTARVR